MDRRSTFIHINCQQTNIFSWLLRRDYESDFYLIWLDFSRFCDKKYSKKTTNKLLKKPWIKYILKYKPAI